MSDWLQEDRFEISQLIRPMVNLYKISAGFEGDETRRVHGLPPRNELEY